MDAACASSAGSTASAFDQLATYCPTTSTTAISTATTCAGLQDGLSTFCEDFMTCVTDACGSSSGTGGGSTGCDPVTTGAALTVASLSCESDSTQVAAYDNDAICASEASTYSSGLQSSISGYCPSISVASVGSATTCSTLGEAISTTCNAITSCASDLGCGSTSGRRLDGKDEPVGKTDSHARRAQTVSATNLLNVTVTVITEGLTESEIARIQQAMVDMLEPGGDGDFFGYQLAAVIEAPTSIEYVAEPLGLGAPTAGGNPTGAILGVLLGLAALVGGYVLYKRFCADKGGDTTKLMGARPPPTFTPGMTPGGGAKMGAELTVIHNKANFANI